MSHAAPEKQWTILSLLQWSEAYLSEKQIESPRLTAELLLASVLNCERIHLYTRFDQPLVREELDQYKTLLRRRLRREPLQYILGYTEFFGRRIRVREGVLIPRPETEHVVEAALEIVRDRNMEDPLILDIGTGSGCIALTLAQELPRAKILAIDVSEEALTIAHENVTLHGVDRQVSLKKLDVFHSQISIPDEGNYDLIVSNPPYISRNEWEQLPDEIKLHEPKYALTDGDDGLRFYKRMAHLAPKLLRKNGWLICEVGYDQFERVEALFDAHEIRCWKDLSGIKRIIGGTW